MKPRFRKATCSSVLSGRTPVFNSSVYVIPNLANSSAILSWLYSGTSLASLLISTLSFSKDYDYKAEADKKSIEILNVSYDPTREFYEDYNKNFAKYWQEKRDIVTGKQIGRAHV